VAFPSGNLVEAEYRLQGSIVRFDADTAGRAVLVVQWGIAPVSSRQIAVLLPIPTSCRAYQAAARARPGGVRKHHRN
jgi:hypothetical protein